MIPPVRREFTDAERLDMWRMRDQGATLDEIATAYQTTRRHVVAALRQLGVDPWVSRLG